MSILKKGDIFSREKKRTFLKFPKLTKARLILGSLALVLLALLAIPSFTNSATKVIKAQTVDADHWWNKEDCNGSEAPYNCQAQDAYPVEPIDNLDPLPTLSPEDPYPAPDDGYNTNPADYQQGSSAIIQLQQQIQNQMASCVQTRTQMYNQLVTQYRQYNQLEDQLDAINSTISRTTDERRATALQNQADRIQQSIDRMYDTRYDTQTRLDDALADCRDRINDLQTRQDELEQSLIDQFSTSLDYEVPN